jgi:uncharacterized membrane protein
MLLPDLSSTGYKIVLILHVVFVVAAFGGMFVLPILSRTTRGTDAGGSVAQSMVTYLKRIAIPSMLAAGILGIGLVSLSKPDGSDTALWSFKQGWVSASMAIWIALSLVYVLGLLPTERKLAEGDETAAKRIPMFTGIVHLGLVVMIYLMLFKPGS